MMHAATYTSDSKLEHDSKLAWYSTLRGRE
jgi:hypothetical protein